MAQRGIAHCDDIACELHFGGLGGGGTTYALETLVALLGLGAGEVAQAIVLALSIVVVASVKGYNILMPSVGFIQRLGSGHRGQWLAAQQAACRDRGTHLDRRGGS